METSVIHQADGGREEEWAEFQQWAESQQGIPVTLTAVPDYTVRVTGTGTQKHGLQPERGSAGPPTAAIPPPPQHQHPLPRHEIDLGPQALCRDKPKQA
ncbi:hypothetical protein EYF80_050005 [Liparis tanakae]|uniref:Uncharacterized protein n=1 Tax=Liparis tanakae TaxID=230148 RepID=A0A4Z2FGF7_9TELE|nr:hypothetical protein EYF80_050005 [Liparis tanakae]